MPSITRKGRSKVMDARGQKNPAPRGYEARGSLHVTGVLQSTALARELVEFQGAATERKKGRPKAAL
jgi:hypothetical protein